MILQASKSQITDLNVQIKVKTSFYSDFGEILVISAQ